MSRRRQRRKARAHTAAAPAAPPRRGGAERALRAALFGSLGLVLLTPFVVTTSTLFPFIVGKALWSRTFIEIAFALWAVLALTRPGYAPPRSRVLFLLAAGLAVSTLSAVFGVSAQHSLWSDYERMLGVVDQAHWFALAVVLASVLRSSRAWRRLLGANVALSAAIAAIAAARALDIEVPFYGTLAEREARIGGPLGNPVILSVYLLVNAVLALGFAARAWAAGPPLGWLAAAALHLFALVLAGSVGAFVGLAAAAGFAALVFAWLARGRRRVAAMAVVAVLLASAAALGVRVFDPARTSALELDALTAQWPGAAALGHLSGVHLQRPSVQSRLAAWEAGLEGFAERPLLGWGPGNYTAVFGLYGTGYAATAEPHDLAHGKFIEVAATTGAMGILAWLALWGLALAVFVLAARAQQGPERTFTVFAAAALAGHVVQLQFLFDTAAGTLVATLLLAYAATLEPRALPPPWRAPFRGLTGPIRARMRARPRLRAAMTGRRARAVLGAGALALAFSGLAVNRTILTAADSRPVLSEAQAAAMAGDIEAFPALAGFYRKTLFAELAHNWTPLRAADPARASALLEWADREAREAVRAEPWNWRYEHLLARLYAVVSRTDPAYETAARHHLARARELAPAREVFPAALPPPDALTAIPPPRQGLASDARMELGWRPVPGAGYHQVARSDRPGAWRPILYQYDPARTTIEVPAGPHRYRIKACRYPRDCSPWVEWP